MSEVKYCAYCGNPIENPKDKKCRNCGSKILRRQRYILRVIIYSIIGSLFMGSFIAYMILADMITPQSLAKGKMSNATMQYSKIAKKYMEDNNKKDLSGALGENCEKAGEYFEILSGSGCNFMTKNGIYWEFDSKTGNAAVSDFIPMYNMLLWTKNGTVIDENNKPDNLKYPTIKGGKGIITLGELRKNP